MRAIPIIIFLSRMSATSGSSSVVTPTAHAPLTPTPPPAPFPGYKLRSREEKRAALFEEKDEENLIFGESKSSDDNGSDREQEMNLDAEQGPEREKFVKLHPIETFKRNLGDCLSSIFCCCHVTIPDDHHADVVEFERFKKTIGPGMHAYNPVTETVHLVRDIFVKENKVGLVSVAGKFSKVVHPGAYHVNRYLNEELKIVPLTIVPENHKGIVTRSGKFNRVLESGQHFINELLEEKIYVQKETIVLPTQIAVMIKNGKFVKNLPSGKFFANPILNEEIIVVKMVEIPEGFVGLSTVEGKFVEILQPGGYFPRAILQEEIYPINLQSITDELKPQKIVTKDTTSISTQSILVYKIVNPYKAHYEVKDLDFAIRECAKTISQQVLSEYDLDHIMKSKSELSAIIQKRVASICEKYGVLIERIDIRDIFFEKSLEADLAETAKARRTAEARRITADAEIEIAQRMEKIYDSPGAMHMRNLDTMRAICESSNTRVLFIPGISMPSASFSSSSNSSSGRSSGMDRLPARVLERVIASEAEEMKRT